MIRALSLTPLSSSVAMRSVVLSGPEEAHQHVGRSVRRDDVPPAGGDDEAVEVALTGLADDAWVRRWAFTVSPVVATGLFG